MNLIESYLEYLNEFSDLILKRRDLIKQLNSMKYSMSSQSKIEDVERKIIELNNKLKRVNKFEIMKG